SVGATSVVITFPRLQRRGLIEAPSLSVGVGCKHPDFPGYNAGASLKLAAILRLGFDFAELFPRLQRRGLIEARPSAGRECPFDVRFPRLQRRGLIEACMARLRPRRQR